MKKIDNYISSALFSLALLDCDLVSLSQYWSPTIVLKGNYCRLYYNTEEGAVLTWRGRQMPLRRRRFYLVAPNARCHATCALPYVRHLFFHFTATPISFKMGAGVMELPPNTAMSELADALVAAIPPDNNGLTVIPLPTATSLCLMALEAAGAFVDVRKDHPSARLIRTIIEDIRISMEREDLSIEHYSSYFGVHKATLARNFRRFAGTTFYHWVMEERYRAAKEMLASNYLLVKEICKAIGIHDQRHFSREFKRRFGLSPLEYRRQALKD